MYNQLVISNIYLITGQFMLALIEHSPDIYLDEIQEQLRDLHEVDVSVATIWRTLKRLGIGSILHIGLTIITCHVVVEDGC
jgi:hypothetical protein